MDIFSTILGIVGNVVGDLSAEQQAKITLALQQDAEMNKLLEGQQAIDEAEAANPNWFVSSWRPLVGWTCALTFAWTYLIEPIIIFSAAAYGHPITNLPVLNTSDMMPVLMGLLGLGGLRTYEKTQNVQNKH